MGAAADFNHDGSIDPVKTNLADDHIYPSIWDLGNGGFVDFPAQAGPANTARRSAPV